MEARVKPPFVAVDPIEQVDQAKARAEKYLKELFAEKDAQQEPLSGPNFGVVRRWTDELAQVKLEDLTSMGIDPGGPNQTSYHTASKSFQSTPPARIRTLSDYSAAELVMEMLGRGYAVMKLPEGGGPPEALTK